MLWHNSQYATWTYLLSTYNKSTTIFWHRASLHWVMITYCSTITIVLNGALEILGLFQFRTSCFLHGVFTCLQNKIQGNSNIFYVFVIEWRFNCSKAASAGRNALVLRGLEVIVMLTYEARVNEVYLCMGGLTTSRRASSAVTGGGSRAPRIELWGKVVQNVEGFIPLFFYWEAWRILMYVCVSILSKFPSTMTFFF